MKIFRPNAVKDADGTTIGYTERTYATYSYNAWGELTGITDSNGNSILNKQTTSTALANLNPLRYRGYYYDNETGFYYLQSRYYDPANRRFINADIFTSTNSTDAIACNMFVYCGNNPVSYEDPNGEIGIIATSLIIAAVSAVVDYGAQVIDNYQDGYTGKEAWVDNISFGRVASTAFSGALAPSSFGVGSAMADFILSPAIELSVDHAIFPTKNDPLTLENYTIRQMERFGDVYITGEICNAISGSYQNPLTSNAIQSTIKEMVKSNVIDSAWSIFKNVFMTIF